MITTYVDSTTLNPYISPYNWPNRSITTDETTLILNSNNMSKVQQTKVAVFKVTRNEENQITNTEFLKEMWIQTKAGTSVDFEVARDEDLVEYKAEDIIIKTITSLIF
jgi:hypothetical protein